MQAKGGLSLGISLGAGTGAGAGVGVGAHVGAGAGAQESHEGKEHGQKKHGHSHDPEGQTHGHDTHGHDSHGDDNTHGHGRVIRHVESRKYHHYHWVAWTIISSLLYAGGFYLLGLESGPGMVAKFVLSIGFLSFSVAYIIYSFFRYRIKHGEWPWFNDTTIADPETRRWRWGVFFTIIFTGILHFFAYFFLVFAYKHAPSAGLNQGIATSVSAFGSIFLALGAFLFYKKRITATEFVSLLVIIGGVVIIVLSKEGVEFVKLDEKPGATVAYVILASFFFVFKSLIARRLSETKKVDTLTPSIIQLFVDGLIGTIIAAVLWGQNDTEIVKYASEDIFNLVASGWLIGFGVVFLTYAIVVGIVRPVYAIWNTVGLWHTIFAWIFLSAAPGSLEFLGLFVILFGTTLLTLGDYFINLITDDTKHRDVLIIEETDALLGGKDLWAHRYT